MKKSEPYWINKKPTGGRKWVYTTSATAIEDATQKEEILRMYRRYVKQWNDIELDHSRSLSEHTHEVCGAKVVGANKKFILHAYEGDQNHWILEILFARGFSQFYPGWSTGKNTMRSTADMKGAYLHWSGAGREAFERWLVTERKTNQARGEWEEYKSR